MRPSTMTQSGYRPLLLGAVAAALLLAPWPPAAVADEGAQRARELVEAGEIMPLEQLLQRLKRERNWRLLEVELEEEDGRLIYEFELIDDSGQVREFELDARSGQPIAPKEDDD